MKVATFIFHAFREYTESTITDMLKSEKSVPSLPYE